jgi:hypothetical protein
VWNLMWLVLLVGELGLVLAGSRGPQLAGGATAGGWGHGWRVGHGWGGCDLRENQFAGVPTPGADEGR